MVKKVLKWVGITVGSISFLIVIGLILFILYSNGTFMRLSDQSKLLDAFNQEYNEKFIVYDHYGNYDTLFSPTSIDYYITVKNNDNIRFMVPEYKGGPVDKNTLNMYETALQNIEILESLKEESYYTYLPKVIKPNTPQNTFICNCLASIEMGAERGIVIFNISESLEKLNIENYCITIVFTTSEEKNKIIEDFENKRPEGFYNPLEGIITREDVIEIKSEERYKYVRNVYTDEEIDMFSYIYNRY